MIYSNYDIEIAKLKLDNNFIEKPNNNFLNSAEDIIKNNNKKDSSFTFENIKGITLEEIEANFSTNEDKNLAKNLRLATLFTNDEKLSRVMFNTVLGKPFDVGYEYLVNRYNDKSIYSKSKFSTFNSSLSDLLHKSVTNRMENKQGISKENLDDILLQIHSFDFLSSFSRSSKKLKDRYKDDNKYSFLYRNYELEYQDLIDKYKNLNNQNLDIIKQF